MAINIQTGTGIIPVNDYAEAEDLIRSGGSIADKEVYLKDIDKGVIKVPGIEASNALSMSVPGVSLATPEEVELAIKSETYKGPIQQSIAAAQGALSGATLGTGDALTKSAIGVLSPKDSTLAKKFSEGSREREEVYPGTRILGEVVGSVADPLGIYGAIGKGLKAGTAATGKAMASATEKLAPEVIKKAVGSKLVQSTLGSGVVTKSAERAARYGTEGALIGGTYELGKQLRDDDEINVDAIMDASKTNALYGAALGPAVSVSEQAGALALKGFKKATKGVLDKITGAPPEARGEIFGEMPRSAMKKVQDDFTGRNQTSLKVSEELVDGKPLYTFKKGDKVASFEISPTATGLDFDNLASVDELGSKIGVDNLSEKYRWGKEEGESVQEFLAREVKNQRVSNALEDYSLIMSDSDKLTLDRLKKAKSEIESSPEITPQLKAKYYTAIIQEQKLFREINGNPLLQSKKEIADDIYKTKKALSEYDYVKRTAKNGEKEFYIFNENIIPEQLQTTIYPRGIDPVSFEAGQMAKQFKMSPKQMQMKGRGNERLNEVSEFIFDQYPKQGSFVTKGTTGIDKIIENIDNVKQKAGYEIEEVITDVLNSGTRQSIKTTDIANFIESKILPQFVDAKSGNPLAGFEKEFNEIRKFADDYKNNGYVLDQYGRRKYIPMTIEEIQQSRIRMDKKAKFDKDTLTAMNEAARETRTFLEEKIMSMVGEKNSALKNKYIGAKKQYGLAKDAESIINAAAKKSAKASDFNFMYSAIGAGAAGSVFGPAGAIFGGLAGGMASNAMKQYSGSLSVMMARDLGKHVEKYEKMISSAAKAFINTAKVAKNVYIRIPKDNEEEIANKDYTKLMKEIENKEAFLENFMNQNEYLFEQFPKTSEKMVEKMAAGREFLMSKIPKNPYAGNPVKEKNWKPSQYEIDKYMRFREAVNKPSIIINQFKDGYITPEAAEVLNQVYPDTKNALMNAIIDQVASGAEIPFEKRVEIFKTFGIKMDSIMSGAGFIQAQKDASELVAQSQGEQSGMKSSNIFKTNLGTPDYTQGNATIKP